MSAIVTETSAFSASVTVPSPGDNVTAASVANAIQPLCNRTQALVDGKITVKSGVTFTGNLGCTWLNNGTTTLANTSCTSLAATAITCTTLAANGGTVASVSGTATSNGTGVKGTGSGSGSGTTGQGGATGAGVIGTGGATSGVGVSGVGGTGSPGVRGTGGSGGAAGVDAIGTSGAHGTTSLGSGAGAGVVGTGGASAGPGIKGIAGSGGVGIECGAGNMRFTGTQPAATVDTGVDNYLAGTNVCKSWGSVDLSLGVATITDGYNVASVSASGTQLTITLARAMATTGYAPTVSIAGNNVGANVVPSYAVTVTSTTVFIVTFYNSPTTQQSLALINLAVFFNVFGRQ